ncbi:MAG: hypothetical protein GY854_06560 [Deltaproteobacteria bacterium]|nr:hypothetical protein [Deltaproteobacteria bacterium]
MSRTNEFKANTEAFGGIADAMSALDTLMQEVDKSREACTGVTESELTFRDNVAGLKDKIDETIAGSLDEWKGLGLNSSFFQRSEQLDKGMYTYHVQFKHPVYEHLWLTTEDEVNIAADLMSFSTFQIEYSKDDASVKISTSSLKTNFHLPEMRASVRSSQEDLEEFKKEAKRINETISAASTVQNRLFETVNSYCGQNNLEADSTEVQPSQAKPSETKQGAKQESKPMSTTKSKPMAATKSKPMATTSKESVASQKNDDDDSEEEDDDDVLVIEDDFSDDAGDFEDLKITDEFESVAEKNKETPTNKPTVSSKAKPKKKKNIFGEKSGIFSSTSKRS